MFHLIIIISPGTAAAACTESLFALTVRPDGRSGTLDPTLLAQWTGSGCAHTTQAIYWLSTGCPSLNDPMVACSPVPCIVSFGFTLRLPMERILALTLSRGRAH